MSLGSLYIEDDDLFKEYAMSDRDLRTRLIRLAHAHPELRKNILPLVTATYEQGTDLDRWSTDNAPASSFRWAADQEFKTAAWTNLPPGWTQESVQSFWDSLTGDVKHKVTKCMEKMEGKVDDTGAFCGSLGSAVGYRAASSSQDASLFRKAAIRVAHENPALRSVLLSLLSKKASSKRYDVIESKAWVNKSTGQTASIYGAVPWTRSSEKNDWEIRGFGWTVRDNVNGTVGIGRSPWKSRNEAVAWANEANTRLLKRSFDKKKIGGSGNDNAAYLQQSPLKDKILKAVATHYGISASQSLHELTDPDAEAVYEYIGDNKSLQMQVYKEFEKFRRQS